MALNADAVAVSPGAAAAAAAGAAATGAASVVAAGVVAGAASVVVAGAAAGVAAGAVAAAGAAAGAAAASGLDSCLADSQPTTKNIVSAEINDPHDHKVKRLAWFIFFRFYFGGNDRFSPSCNASRLATSEKI
jgi:hypothetical protein